MPIWRLPATKAEMGWRADASQYNAIREGLFTTGIAIGMRSKGWPDYEVKAIAAARIAGKSYAEIRELVKQLHAQRASAGLAAPLYAPPAPAVTPPARNGRLQVMGVTQ